jgi:hypothetical protein
MIRSSRSLFSVILAAGLLPSVAAAGPLADWWAARWQAFHAPSAPFVALPSAGVVQAAPAAPCDTCPSAAGYAVGAGCSTCPTTVARPIAADACQTCYSPVAQPAVVQQGVAAVAAPAAPTYVGPIRRFWAALRGFPNYQTQWVAVPVTTYRPVPTVDPTTGLAVTSLAPCSTYRWQLQRVPAPSYAVGYAPAAVPSHYSQPVVVGPPAYAGSVISAPGGCSTCDGAYPSTPAYETGPSLAPTPSPYPSVPGVPSGPAATVPDYSVPGAVTEPADLRPSLDQGAYSGGASAIPAESRKAVTERQDPLPLRQGDLRLVPVPDPDAGDDAEIEAPQLLNPNDRSASSRGVQYAAYTTIEWPAAASRQPAKHTVAMPVVRRESRTEMSPPQATAPSSTPRQPLDWDDSGWRSAR